MSDCPGSNELAALVDGALSPRQKHVVLAHLATCVDCRNRLERISPTESKPQSSISDDTITYSSEPKDRGSRPDDVQFDSLARVKIEGFEIKGEIHRGGQGVVYRARQIQPQRDVALKILTPRGFDGASAQERFKKEVDFTANLKHPNIVTVYESGFKGGLHYYAMEHIRGEALTAYVKRNRLTVPATLKLFQTVCAAVEFAHQQGIVHRDLKPANILVKEDGAPVVLDFGLAKSTAPPVLGAKTLTHSGEFVGTLAYAAPEQLAGHPELADSRTDVYALGVMLFESLSGQRPYPTLNALRLLLDPVEDAPTPKPSALCPDLSSDVDKVVCRAMAKRKDQRYRSAGAFGDDIRCLVEGEPLDAETSSFAGIVRRRFTGYARRHQFTALLALMLVSIGFGNWFVHRLVTIWTPLDLIFVRTMTAWFAPQDSGRVFNDVVVVAMTDQCNLEAMAASEGLPGVSLAEPRSLRLLHGRMLRKLVEAKPRVVACDIWFYGDSIYDTEINRGIGELADAHIPVVVGLGRWSLAGGPLDVSDAALMQAHAGCMSARLDANHWIVEVAAQRNANRTQPSIALMTVALYRHPMSTPDCLLLPDESSVAIRYIGDEQKLMPTSGLLDRLPLAAVENVRKNNDDFGLRIGDMLGLLQISVPNDSALSAATLSYEHVFGEDAAMLRDRFKGKAVILADKRLQNALGGAEFADYSEYPDGRTIARCYAHAAAIEFMLHSLRETPRSGERVREMLGAGALFVDTGTGALCGLVLACLLYRDKRLLWLSLLSAAVIFCVISLTLAARYQVLLNPGPGLVVLMITGVLGAAIRRLSSEQTTTL